MQAQFLPNAIVYRNYMSQIMDHMAQFNWYSLRHSSRYGSLCQPMDTTLPYWGSYIGQFGHQKSHVGNPIGQLNYYLGRVGSHSGLRVGVWTCCPFFV